MPIVFEELSAEVTPPPTRGSEPQMPAPSAPATTDEHALRRQLALLAERAQRACAD
jgi:hypothetical protein